MLQLTELNEAYAIIPDDPEPSTPPAAIAEGLSSLAAMQVRLWCRALDDNRKRGALPQRMAWCVATMC